MRSSSLPPAVAVALLATAVACSDGDHATNPPALWLDLDGSEIKVRLVEHEPVPF